VNEVIDTINAVIPWPAWSIGLSVLGIIVQALAGPRPKWAWIVGMASQVPWWVYAVVSDQWGFFVSSTIYFVIYAVHHMHLRRSGAKIGQVVEETPPTIITAESEEVPAA
jgi:hypothetical protein